MIRRNCLRKNRFSGLWFIPSSGSRCPPRVLDEASLLARLCELVSQLNESNVKQSLSGTAAVLTPCPLASIPAALMFPPNPPTVPFHTAPVQRSLLLRNLRHKLRHLKGRGGLREVDSKVKVRILFLSEAIKKEDVWGDIKKTDSYTAEVTFDSIRLREKTSHVPMWACFIVRWDLLCDRSHEIKMNEGQNDIWQTSMFCKWGNKEI